LLSWPLLDIRNVKKEYRKGDKASRPFPAVNLAIEKGEFLFDRGPVGSGRARAQYRGNAFGHANEREACCYNGASSADFPNSSFGLPPADNIAFIFQSYNLIPVLTVRKRRTARFVISGKILESGNGAKSFGRHRERGDWADGRPPSQRISGDRSSAWPSHERL